MKRWEQRPFEIRTLFNPAFCGLNLFRALQGYEEEDTRGMPFSLSLLILPLCFHKDSREVLAAGSRSHLLGITEKHPQMQVGFSDRATTMIPYTFEGFDLLMERGCILLSDEGRLQTVSGKVKKSVTGTHETKSCQRVARYLGKEFARIADRITVYTSFGIRP
ncbi:three component ABC system middle component [Sedimenticola hydrogenitrophicus]|uniref:three component ABC system middle component n=1 Tax=Sedimenticola hydrogenitrophicus TaxID=2967975 RepID=UPI0023B1D46F|nr:three component ABC system middle component [Sedimenticola hydrogenitrophicus]